jgi:hypothetical protein
MRLPLEVSTVTSSPALICPGWFQVSEGDALTDSMAVGATGGQADQITVMVDRFVAEALTGKVIVEQQVGQFDCVAILLSLLKIFTADEITTGIR